MIAVEIQRHVAIVAYRLTIAVSAPAIQQCVCSVADLLTKDSMKQRQSRETAPDPRPPHARKRRLPLMPSLPLPPASPPLTN